MNPKKELTAQNMNQNLPLDLLPVGPFPVGLQADASGRPDWRARIAVESLGARIASPPEHMVHDIILSREACSSE